MSVQGVILARIQLYIVSVRVSSWFRTWTNLETECTVSENITEKSYILGCKSIALNNIVLELKKEILYSKNLNACLVSSSEHFVAKIRRIIVKEKQIMIANDKFEDFCNKWQGFTAIYDFLGPDYQIIY